MDDLMSVSNAENELFITEGFFRCRKYHTEPLGGDVRAKPE
jgi:hypothetical protein